MKAYIIKSAVLVSILLISVSVGSQVMGLRMLPVSYIGIVYIALLFNIVQYFTHHDVQISENKRIRRLMIGSMVRLFLVLIFLAISLFNMKPIELTFVAVYGLTFLFFLFFDILEMRTNLRPETE